MNKKNLYKEEDQSSEEEEDTIVDYADMVEGENHTGINFFRPNEENVVDSEEDHENENENEDELENKDEVCELSNKKDQHENNMDIDENKLENGIKEKIDLLDLDLESMPKDDLINLLLLGDQPLADDKKKKNVPKKIQKTGASQQNTINTLNSSNITHQTNLTNSNPLHYIETTRQLAEVKDPELNSDFNTALTKILTKMVKESNNPNQEVMDILLGEREKIEEELNKYEFSKKIKIDEKVKNYIDRKNKNLEIIQEKVNEDFNKNCTFAPNIVNKTNRRKLEQFLHDQDEHMKKIQNKIDILRDEKIKEREVKYQTAPKINESSKRMLEDKKKVDTNSQVNDKVHERLYNQRNKNSNKQDVVSKSTNNLIVSKKVEERAKILYQDAVNRQVRQKESLKNNKNDAQPKTSTNSNKYFFKKFKEIFREEIEKIFQEVMNSSGNATFNNLNKLNFTQMHRLLQNINFVSLDGMEEESASVVINPLSSKHQEAKMVNEVYENIKDSEGLVNVDHLFIFCLSVLNLLEYYVVKCYKTQMDQEDGGLVINISSKSLKSSISNTKVLNKKFSVMNLNDDAYTNLVHKLNLDLNSRIVSPKKYGGLDIEDNFIITFTHSKLIFKEFNLFSLNYNQNLTRKNNYYKAMDQQQDQTFKPKINPKSVQLSNKYRMKVINEYENYSGNIINDTNMNKNLHEVSELTNLNLNIPSKSKNFDLPHFSDVMIMKKNKQEKMNEKIREEREMRELEQCTFKPKINQYQYRDNVMSIDQLMKDQRIEVLHKKGTEIIINKKDKTKEEMEIEKYGKECTFRPLINSEKDIESLFDREVVVDKDVQKFNERLKRGRIDKEIKDAAFTRGQDFICPHTAYDDKKEIKRNKSEGKITKRLVSNSSKNNILDKIKDEEKILEPLDDDRTENFKKYEKFNLYKSEKKEKGKNLINLVLQPLLIIDVNIKPGEKKQITVFEGDTAEKLANSFAIEHNLDSNIKGKLEKLVQNQISKLLAKIDEEKSLKSEKSNGFV